jgi:NitT/TauT family transport system ATP-binding protein
VILMDEPFGALDAQTRTQLHGDLLRLWNLGRKTIVFVTHDIAEAIALGDRVLVLSRAPARVIGEHLVEIPRPRKVDALLAMPGFAGLYERVRAQLA